MPDGFDRRPTTGDRQPARRTAAQRYDDDDDLYDEPRRGADPYGDPYQDDYDDADSDIVEDSDADSDDDPGGGERRGPARRLASWLGFGVGSDETYGEPRSGTGPDDDLYDAPPPAIPPQPTAPPPLPGDDDAPPYRSRGSADAELTDDTWLPEARSARTDDDFDTSSTASAPLDAPGAATGSQQPPAAARPRRTRATSPWEDIMLGSGPPPGTPMSDAMPAGTLPPDPYTVRPPAAAADAPSVPLSDSPTRRAGETRSGTALSDWLDPMDPVDPLDPNDPTGTPEDADTDDASVGKQDVTSETGSSESSFDDPGPTGTIAAALPIPAPAAPAAPPPPAAPAPRVSTLKQPAADKQPKANKAPDVDDVPDESPEPRRMLRLLPTPVLADGGGMVVDGGGVGRLTVRAAAARGDLHTQHGVPRQNCFAAGPDPSRRWTISIVCDGVDGGYAPELAAQVAIRSTYRAVARMVMSGRHEDWDWTTTLAGVQAELRTRLTEIGAKARSLGRPAPATRLAVLVTSAEPLQDDRVDMAVLGDSTILRLAEGGWRAPLGIREVPADVPPPALPEQGTEHVRVCRTTWRPSDALVLMTGGFAEALGAASGGLAARLAEDWRRPPELLDFLHDVAEGSHAEDGAVVALWPEP